MYNSTIRTTKYVHFITKDILTTNQVLKKLIKKTIIDQEKSLGRLSYSYAKPYICLKNYIG